MNRKEKRNLRLALLKFQENYNLTDNELISAVMSFEVPLDNLELIIKRWNYWINNILRFRE